MVRLSMNELTTFRWPFDEDVRHYAAAGFDAIAVWRQKVSDFGEEKAIELLEDSPLSVSTLLWAGGFTGSDGRTHTESVEDALEAVQLAGDLKANSLVVYTGSRSGHTHNHAKRLFRHAVEALLPCATECGVTLAIEPMHAGCASAWTFLTDLDETLAPDPIVREPSGQTAVRRLSPGPLAEHRRPLAGVVALDRASATGRRQSSAVRRTESVPAGCRHAAVASHCGRPGP